MKKKIGTAKRAIPCEKISTTTPPYNYLSHKHLSCKNNYE